MSNILWPAPVQSVLECKIPHELDVLKWKAIGGGGGEEEGGGGRRRGRRKKILTNKLQKIIEPTLSDNQH
jgi:hypothetical protein